MRSGSKVSSAGQLPTGFDPGALYQSRSHPRGLQLTVYGASDAQAAYVKDNPVSTSDVCATIYHCLGIDPHMRVPDRTNRPVEIAHGGKPITGILA